MSYSSEINLGGLGESPKTKDPEVFPDMTDVYNAIHILAQWVDMLYQNEKNKVQPEERGDELTRFVTVRAAVDITAGMFVSVPTSFVAPPRGPNAKFFNGAVPGYWTGEADTFTAVVSPSFPVPSGTFPVKVPAALTFGIATQDAAAGEMVKIGLGPGQIDLPGANVGDTVWVSKFTVDARGNHTSDGNFYVVPFDTRNVNTRNLVLLEYVNVPDKVNMPIALRAGENYSVPAPPVYYAPGD